MTKDPDIIRWSQLKRFLIHVVGWLVIYGVCGWLIDITQYSEASTTSHIVILVGLSLLMAYLTTRKD
tara:strand:+ start:474 stop:674 length:201 start_codon:yes stop_codon:yes gene_type:complete